ncbi:MAG: MMPL family transporter, partial [Nanoarchaeota archaeon]|nr:MMPL family transporter [Nanoarchaeota archaeon]
MADSYHNFLKRVAHFQVKHPVVAILLVFFLTMAIYGGVANVRTVASLEQMMPKHIEEISAFNALRDNNLGQDIIAIVVEVNRDSSDPNGIIDIRDKRAVDYVRYLNDLVKGEMDVRTTYAVSDYIPVDFPEEGYEDFLSGETFSGFISRDYTKTMVIIMTDISANDMRMNLLSDKIKEDIESAGHPPGIVIKLTGTPIIQQKLGELISNDRSSTQWISTFLVFVITMFIFGTFSSALVPINK